MANPRQGEMSIWNFSGTKKTGGHPSQGRPNKPQKRGSDPQDSRGRGGTPGRRRAGARRDRGGRWWPFFFFFFAPRGRPETWVQGRQKKKAGDRLNAQGSGNPGSKEWDWSKLHGAGPLAKKSACRPARAFGIVRGGRAPQQAVRSRVVEPTILEQSNSCQGPGHDFHRAAGLARDFPGKKWVRVRPA